MVSKEAFRASVALAVSLSAAGCRTRPQQPITGQTVSGPVEQSSRFSGSVRVQTTGGATAVKVEIVNVNVSAGQSVDRLPLPYDGTLMVHLQAGEITTVIGGRREQRRQGQIWTVPPGVAMGLATGRDAASLQTILVER